MKRSHLLSTLRPAVLGTALAAGLIAPATWAQNAAKTPNAAVVKPGDAVTLNFVNADI